MKNNGFTLVEMLAVLVLLSLIMVLLIPGYIYVYTSVRRNTLNDKIRNLETASLEYGEKVKDTIKTSLDSTTCKDIEIDDLIKKGYIQSDENGRDVLINTVDKSDLDGKVRLCYCSDELKLESYYYEPYDSSVTYHKGDKVLYRGKVFECTADSAPAGSIEGSYKETTTTRMPTTTRAGETTTRGTSVILSDTSRKYFVQVECN